MHLISKISNINSNETSDWESDYYSALCTKEKQLIARIIGPVKEFRTLIHPFQNPFKIRVLLGWLLLVLVL